MNKLTVKQENFCQAYIRLGDKSAAYREAYNSQNMKAETVNKRASELSLRGDIKGRIEFLRKEIYERNKMTIDELINILSNIARFDIVDFYDENGALKPIHKIPKEARQMISQLDVFEEFIGFGDDKALVGFTKKVKTLDKLVAIEKLMRYFGAYKADNDQSKPEIVINWNEQKTYEKKD